MLVDANYVDVKRILSVGKELTYLFRKHGKEDHSKHWSLSQAVDGSKNHLIVSSKYIVFLLLDFKNNMPTSVDLQKILKCQRKNPNFTHTCINLY